MNLCNTCLWDDCGNCTLEVDKSSIVDDCCFEYTKDNEYFDGKDDE